MKRPLPLTEAEEIEVFSLLWRINDCLAHENGECRFTGSSNDIDDFREMLHRVDPLYKRHTWRDL